jgi:DNA (cytosine-5)-methyltransferase 1
MQQLRVLDLFSGIGGFSLGLERAGMRTVAFCEIDPYCQKVLSQHWPSTEVHGDVTQRGFVEGEADVITAGFPCQDISLAGDGAGLAGARSGLYRHVIRAIRLVRPRFAVLENVAALLGRGMGTVLGDMAEVGYDAEWHCIPASAVGAPHRRDRVWIIADTGGEQHQSNRPPLSGTIAEELSRANSYSYRERELQSEGAEQDQRRRIGNVGSQMADPDRDDVQGIISSFSDQKEWRGSVERQIGPCSDGNGWWSVEPDVGRVAYGVPSGVDRLKALGNSVVPQIPEIIGRAIMRAAQ